MEERLPLAEALRAVLAEDRTLLARREDLLAAMEQRVTPALMRDYRSFQKAIQGSTVGEMVLAADGASVEERKSVCAQAMEVLGGLGMQERAALRVVGTLVQGLGWSDEPAEEPEEPERMAFDDLPEDFDDVPHQDADAVIDLPAAEVSPVLDVASSPAAPVEARALSWTCRCGHVGNQGNFCVRCGTSRAEGEADPAAFWACICGHHGNKGNFCVHCGRSRAEGEQTPERPSLIWVCRCGHHGNAGKFCTNCGASRAEGEVETWACACGYQENTGNFCTNCGRPRNR